MEYIKEFVCQFSNPGYTRVLGQQPHSNKSTTMEKLLTIAQISQQLSIPESTLRYRAKLFSDFFPTRGDGRKKRFLPICIERFQFVDALFSKGLIAEDIRAELGERYEKETQSTDTDTSGEDHLSPALLHPGPHASEKELQEILEPMVKMIENQETIIEELKRQNRMLADPTVGTDKKKTLARVFG